MGITKTIGFTKETNDMAEVLKALGHPARLAIMQLLMKSNSCICGDLVEELPLAQSTVSKHLSELKKAGLIKGTITGKNLCYCIDEVGFEKIKYFFQNVTKHLDKNKTTLFQMFFENIK
ncbi:ArsR/SmtB family transcription factor [Flavobacterium cellulosilyticum]|uniref:ArsR family transcriptional regulator n=1 Tax=Flavobacterium cellulosilyticum TaxID=2541731 RepID=A0A4R5CQC4_9FLAO|nr:metalloregulator ArsR/SmtB family transcription factor [Flavobacterium cellulosilyticum]TDD99864.1 ArsR family transcriptional regulator [Flavobacterium cellulosilyticum]